MRTSSVTSVAQSISEQKGYRIFFKILYFVYEIICKYVCVPFVWLVFKGDENNLDSGYFCCCWTVKYSS